MVESGAETDVDVGFFVAMKRATTNWDSLLVDGIPSHKVVDASQVDTYSLSLSQIESRPVVVCPE